MESFSKSIWQKLSESAKELMADELFLPFSRNFSTNAERMNNIIKNLSVCLDTDVSLFTKNRDSSRYPY